MFKRVIEAIFDHGLLTYFLVGMATGHIANLYTGASTLVWLAIQIACVILLLICLTLINGLLERLFEWLRRVD